MRTFIVKLLAVSIGVLGSIGVVQAAENVGLTKHNLSTTGTFQVHLTAGTDEVCVFCHSPHTEVTTASAVQPPLWNRTTTLTGFTMYSSATIEMLIAAQPQGVSLACLSCHDGSIAFDQLINGPGSGNFASDPGARQTGWTWLNSLDDMSKVGGIAFIGKDLRADHPISVTYDTTQDPQFQPAAAVVTGGLKLFGPAADQVECASCHNPHEADLATFYRIDNAQSALCTTCHIK